MSDILRDRVISALGDSYDIEGELGRGGMGVVYRAIDRKLRRTVAIKVLPPELAYRDDVRQRFLREAQTAAQLNHPHIVPIYAVEERDGLVCFVMALVDGESLGARIAREQLLAIPDVVGILTGVADALAYAHSRGIVHRDIKPDNILVDRHTGRSLVTDFGIARAAEGDSRLTVTGIAVGTPAYMSPEQAMGEREIDGRSDLYSLAIVGYQMLAGELPFKATNTPSMLMKHISDTPTPLHERRPDLPPALVAAVERAMAKKPNDRWTGAAAFRDALNGAAAVPNNASPAAARNRPALAPPPPPEPPASLVPQGRIEPRPDRERLSSAWKHSAPSGEGIDGRVRDILNPKNGRRDRARDQLRGASDAIQFAGDMARDAIDAANAGWQPRGLSGLPAPVPPWMPQSWRDARRMRNGEMMREKLSMEGREPLSVFGRMSLADRIRSFRRRTASSAITIAMLATINALTTPFPWVLFPAFFIGIGLLRRGASLWADGVRFKDIFGSEATKALQASSSAAQLPALPSANDYALRLAPYDVLAGNFGPQVRRAAGDRMAIHDVLGKLTKADKDLIPDVAPTVDALAERVGSLAQALHRLDEDVRPSAIEDLRVRIDEAKRQPESREREQKLQLLERQLVTMTDLLGRRETLASQLDSAALMLQNMRLDMIALRSAGVQSAIDDVSSATQEARALSRDIAHVLDAAKEIR
ncbi:MAG: protein kinase [Gemmatimonadaceae bacterium]